MQIKHQHTKHSYSENVTDTGFQIYNTINFQQALHEHYDSVIITKLSK